MKVLVAFCTQCGYTTRDLDDLDTHACTPTRQPVATDIACVHCGAAPGNQCQTTLGRTKYEAHSIRWRHAREMAA